MKLMTETPGQALRHLAGWDAAAVAALPPLSAAAGQARRAALRELMLSWRWRRRREREERSRRRHGGVCCGFSESLGSWWGALVTGRRPIDVDATDDGSSSSDSSSSDDEHSRGSSTSSTESSDSGGDGTSKPRRRSYQSLP
jgi:hypothetical protein